MSVLDIHICHQVGCPKCGAPKDKPCISIVNWPEYKPEMYAEAVKDPYQRVCRDGMGRARVHKQRADAMRQADAEAQYEREQMRGWR